MGAYQLFGSMTKTSVKQENYYIDHDYNRSKCRKSSKQLAFNPEQYVIFSRSVVTRFNPAEKWELVRSRPLSCCRHQSRLFGAR